MVLLNPTLHLRCGESRWDLKSVSGDLHVGNWNCDRHRRVGGRGVCLCNDKAKGGDPHDADHVAGHIPQLVASIFGGNGTASGRPPQLPGLLPQPQGQPAYEEAEERNRQKRKPPAWHTPNLHMTCKGTHRTSGGVNSSLMTGKPSVEWRPKLSDLGSGRETIHSSCRTCEM